MADTLDVPNAITLDQLSPTVHELRYHNISAGWLQEYLILADLHIDSKRCRKDALVSFLDRAIERNALIVIPGDVFDAMQGPKDPRASYGDLDPKHLTPRYFDAIIDTAFDILKPYAPLLVLMGQGNHETSVIKHYGRSLLDTLAEKLRSYDKHCHVRVGGYGGWLRNLFTIQTTRHTQSRWKYFHGSGGGGIMSFDTLQVRRKASFLPDCDVYISGHTHDAWVLPIARERLSKEGVPFQDNMWAIKTPTFKDDYGAGGEGWAIERGHPPKPIGGVWGTAEFARETLRLTFTLEVQNAASGMIDLPEDPESFYDSPPIDVPEVTDA